MKIRFRKEYKFYLPDNTRKMWSMKAGDEFNHHNIDLLNKWISRGVAELYEDKPKEQEVEIAMEDVEEKKETKPAPRKRSNKRAK